MKKIICLICAFILISGALIPAVYAVPIDPAAPSSLTVQYSYEGKVYPGLEIKTYRIASVAPDGSIDLTGDFANYPVNIHGITSQAEWKQIAYTLAAYIEADALAPTAIGTTNSSGTVTFADILPGMYLTLAVRVEDEKAVILFENFLTMIPTVNENGALDYNVAAYPKREAYTPTEKKIEYKIVKLWRDEGKERPDTVEIEILKNGAHESTQLLSAENNWTYTWEAPDDGAVWNAVERNIGDGYTVTLEKNGNSFVIINTLKTDDPDAPQTGDTLSLWHVALPMSLAGGVILILAAWRRRYENA